MMHKVACIMVPALKAAQPKSWMGIRPTFPDGLPVVGKLHGHEGLFGAFGHSHYGFMMAPKTGRLIADLISGRPSNLDLSAFSSMRFR